MGAIDPDQQGDNRWKAESLSFLHVLLVWGVALTSLLIKTRQSSGCDLIVLIPRVVNSSVLRVTAPVRNALPSLVPVRCKPPCLR